MRSARSRHRRPRVYGVDVSYASDEHRFIDRNAGLVAAASPGQARTRFWERIVGGPKETGMRVRRVHRVRWEDVPPQARRRLR